MRARAAAAVLLACVFSIGPLVETALGQTDSADAAQGRFRPVLGQHRFIPNPLTEDPFPRTYVMNSLGVGTALDLVVIPDFTIGNDTIQGVTGDLIFALLDFRYSQRIKDWMGFWITAKLRGRLGNDVGALVTEGVTVSTGFDIGWLFKVLERERIALGLTAQVSKNDFTGINLAEFLKGVVEGQPVPLVQKVPTLWAGSEARFAWGLNPWLGLTATVGGFYGEPADRTLPSKFAWGASGGASLDFTTLIKIPIGAVLGVEAASEDPDGDSSANTYAGLLRIAYTGRKDFSIALDIRGSRTRLFSGSRVNIGSTRVSMRYFF